MSFHWSELKQLFTYSPIHLFTFLLSSFHSDQNCAPPLTNPNCAGLLICWYTAHFPVKLSCDRVAVQVRIGTCTTSLEIKRKNGCLFSFSELKHLFTYSLSSLLLPSFLPFSILGVQNQNSAESFQSTRIGRMRLNRPPPNQTATMMIHRHRPKSNWAAARAACRPARWMFERTACDWVPYSFSTHNKHYVI